MRPLRILIAPDKFKGTLSAPAVAKAIARGWRLKRPRDYLEILPITDGGDGFGAALALPLQARPLFCRTQDAAHRTRPARMHWSPDCKTAVIESASAIGLASLPHRKFHPFKLDTAGLAALLRAAANRHPNICLIGIGGSATNDGGFGMAKALGWQFLDHEQKSIEHWPDLAKLKTITPPVEALRFKKLLTAVDVQNPLLGPRGATRIYGPQKGLAPADFPTAEAALRQLARVVRQHFKFDFAALPGAGAAGGLGFGLAAFCGAKLVSGFQLFSQYTRLEKLLPGFDLVITGEGFLDRSSFMGKGVGELARLCDHLNIPCAAISGALNLPRANVHLLQLAVPLLSLTSATNAKSKPAYWISRAAQILTHSLTWTHMRL